MQEMWSGCWTLEPLTTPPIKSRSEQFPILITLGAVGLVSCSWTHPLPLQHIWQRASRPVYTHIQIKVHVTLTVFFNNFFNSIFRKVRVFLFLATDQGQRVVTPAVCRRFGNRRLHHACLRFVSQQEHLFPHCFGNFSISFLFYFVLSENNLKIISTCLPEKWQMLILCSRITSLALNCLRTEWYYTKHNTETNTTAARGHEIHMCHRKPRAGHILDWKKRKTRRKTCLKLFTIILFFNFIFSCAETLSRQNMPRS